MIYFLYLFLFSFTNLLAIDNNLIYEPIQPIELPKNLNSKKVKLGEKLFSDTRLSKNDGISCSSCHDLSFSGTDNLEKSFGIDGKKGSLNTPTVFNSSLNFVQFWDGRAANLFEQIDGPIHNPVEMSSNWNEIINKLNKDKQYVYEFNSIYEMGISEGNIKDAIVEFEKSLITPSRFDRFLKGDSNAISSVELEGYNLFKNYGCISCHQGRNIGGNFYEKLGVYKEYPNKNNDNYFGRYNITKIDENKFEFKVPSLRNVYYTYPYFHDGSIKTLDEAIKIMAEYQIGRKITNEDVEKIKSFLKSLSYEKIEKENE